jgi:hypothetical protein
VGRLRCSCELSLPRVRVLYHRILKAVALRRGAEGEECDALKPQGTRTRNTAQGSASQLASRNRLEHGRIYRELAVALVVAFAVRGRGRGAGSPGDQPRFQRGESPSLHHRPGELARPWQQQPRGQLPRRPRCPDQKCRLAPLRRGSLNLCNLVLALWILHHAARRYFLPSPPPPP